MEDLWVEVAGRSVLRGVNLEVGEGELVALMGPNGSGKSSLLHAIMGNPKYRVVRGRIEFRGRDITGLSPDERARIGLGIAMQMPPRLKGIRLGDLLERIARMRGTSMDEVLAAARLMRAEKLLDRDLHEGFSGGEIKRAELLLLLAQRPKFFMLDEPDSGVDVESLPHLGEVIRRIHSSRNDRAFERSSGIIVTHTGSILKHVPSVNRTFILINGRIRCFGDPGAILEDVERYGFEGCVNCVLVEGGEG